MGQTLVGGASRSLENCEREAWQPTNMDLVGSLTRGGVHGSVVLKFSMRELFSPLDFELVDDHRQYLVHRVVYTFRPTVDVFGDRSWWPFAEPLAADGNVQELGAELEVAVREGAARASPEGNVPVDARVVLAGVCRGHNQLRCAVAVEKASLFDQHILLRAGIRRVV